LLPNNQLNRTIEEVDVTALLNIVIHCAARTGYSSLMTVLASVASVRILVQITIAQLTANAQSMFKTKEDHRSSFLFAANSRKLDNVLDWNHQQLATLNVMTMLIAEAITSVALQDVPTFAHNQLTREFYQLNLIAITLKLQRQH
jgi:hypothetical protein